MILQLVGLENYTDYICMKPMPDVHSIFGHLLFLKKVAATLLYNIVIHTIMWKSPGSISQMVLKFAVFIYGPPLGQSSSCTMPTPHLRLSISI